MAVDATEDFSIIVTAFFLKCAGFWLAKNPEEQRKRNLAVVYIVIAVLYGVQTQSMHLYYSWNDFDEIVYIGCNLGSLLNVLYKILIFSIYRTEFIKLIEYTQKHFWQETYEEKDLSIVRQCKKTSILFVSSFTALAFSTVLCYTLTPIIANIGVNATDKQLPFKIWYDIPYWKTPYYEVFFITQILSTLHAAIGYICFDNLLCILNIHTAGQFRMLQRRLTMICGSKDINFDNVYTMQEEKSKEIFSAHTELKGLIQRHKMLINYVNNIEEIYTIDIMGQMLIFSVLICLDGYEVLLENCAPTRRTTFLGHLLGTTLQLFMITYTSHSLVEESVAVGNAIYESLWYTLPMNGNGRKIRKDLQFIYMRSQVPCCLTAGGFFAVSLETFTTVLRTAMSYFTLLRQFSE